jgi:hypothetical protein
MKYRPFVKDGVCTYLGIQTAAIVVGILDEPRQPDVSLFKTPVIAVRHYPQVFLPLPDLDSTSTITMVNSLVHSSSS